MKSISNVRYRLMLAFVLSITCISYAESRVDGPEIVVWPHQQTNQLYVARETTQPFYVTAYRRGMDIQGTTDVEFTIPENWQAWQLTEAPPQKSAPAAAGRILKYALPLRPAEDEAGSKKYARSHAAGFFMMVAKPLLGATESILKIRWLQNATVLAERQIALKPVSLGLPFKQVSNNRLTAGLWVGNPPMNTETMAEVYRGFRQSGVDYIITTKAVYQQTRESLDELKINVFVQQWWKYRSYMPGSPPPEAYSTLKDGSIDRNRWSPTYMAEGGTEFIRAVESIADELKQIDGIYGFMLDYEPGIPGIEADYSEYSRQVFQKYLGKEVTTWPGDVLTNGKYEEEWINFRNDQSEAYVRWFQKIIKQRAPKLHVAVSTSGATGKTDDPNRRLAVTDITQLSRVSDSIHPQLYSWTSILPAQLKRFNDKLKLGQTTIAGTHSDVYPAVGSMSGESALSNPEYLRTQILNWWFHGASGFEIWSNIYGVDGRYMAMANELAHIFKEAGE